MALTAQSSMPVQTEQVQGGPAPTRPSADILLRRGKKQKQDNHDTRGKGNVQPDSKPSADILMRRKK